MLISLHYYPHASTIMYAWSLLTAYAYIPLTTLNVIYWNRSMIYSLPYLYALLKSHSFFDSHSFASVYLFVLASSLWWLYDLCCTIMNYNHCFILSSEIYTPLGVIYERKSEIRSIRVYSRKNFTKIDFLYSLYSCNNKNNMFT